MPPKIWYVDILLHVCYYFAKWAINVFFPVLCFFTVTLLLQCFFKAFSVYHCHKTLPPGNHRCKRDNPRAIKKIKESTCGIFYIHLITKSYCNNYKFFVTHIIFVMRKFRKDPLTSKNLSNAKPKYFFMIFENQWKPSSSTQHSAPDYKCSDLTFTELWQF